MHAVYSGGPAGAGWTQQPTIPGHVMATAIAPLIALSAAAAPVAAVSAPPWMAPLKKALQHGGTQRQKRSRSEAKRKHVQLATVCPETGRPAVRTVVFRGFHGDSCLMAFVTDSRSDKVRHIRGGATQVECCWWLDEAGVQFRIAGRAVLCLLDSEEHELRSAAADAWDRLSSSTRETFTWPQPGASVDSSSAQYHKEPPASYAEAGHFCLLIVIPEVVDELRLGGRQRRVIYTSEVMRDQADEQHLLVNPVAWTAREVNP